MANGDTQPLSITIPRRGANVVQGLPPSEGKSPLAEFMSLVQPGQPPTGTPQPASKPPTESLIQPSPEMAKVAPTPSVIGKVGKGLINEFMNLVKIPGETYQQKPEKPGMLSEEDIVKSPSVGEAGFTGMQVGLNLAGARFPFAKTGEIGVFGGKGARAADLSKLQRAQDMDVAKTPMEQIRQKTWWFKDVDDQWKFEIPDKGSKFTKPFDDFDLKGVPITSQPATTLSKVYDHPRLYQNYPELKDIRVQWDAERGGAAYSPSLKAIRLDPYANEATLRSQVSHEIQHWIQFKEGFGIGGNPDALLQAARTVLKYKGVEKPTPQQLDDLSFEIYKRLAGETESRNVQKRIDYTPEQMLAEHPPTTSDVPPEKQIVRTLGDPSTKIPDDLFKSTQREIELGEDYEVKSAPKGLKWAEKVFSPTTRSLTAQDAAASIREASGQAARDKATTMAQLEPYQRTINAMSDSDRLVFLDYVEGRSKGAQLRDPSLQGMADVLRDAFMRRQAKLSNIPATMLMQFVDDFFPHFWENPGAAQQFGHRWIGRMGSSASLKKRTVPTIADGIAYGLKPLTTNPLEATARYITSMDNFIARIEVMEAAKANGTITFPRAQQIGASGHPQSGQLPRTDLVPLKGVTDKMGNQGYAPEDWARIWNNYVGQRWGGNADWSNIADAIQRGSNQITSLELGLSGFHVFTMANEAFISELARGISNIAGGNVTRGLGAIAKAATAPVRLARLGHKAEAIYLDRTPGTPSTRKLVDLITRAGGRMVGKEHAADYDYSAMGDFFTAFRRGALKQQLREAAGRVTGPISAGKEGLDMLGRIMETSTYHLFVKYIPKLKNGAAMELLGDWVKANPTATYEEQLAVARRIWDSVDNRFGEMVQDNIFWDRTLKQVAQIGMRSYSWNLGTVKEIGGGVTGARHPSRLSISSPDYDPKLSYVLALSIGTAIIGMVYQYLKTPGWMPGQNVPENPQQAHFPLTGGQAPGFGGRGEVPERMVPPGYMKDVYGWWHDPLGEAANKLSTGPQVVSKIGGGIASSFTSGTDYQGHLVANPSDPVYLRILDYFKWVGESLTPISIKSLIQGQKRGSNISPIESMLGIRPAPSYVQDPEGYEHGMGKTSKQRYKREKKSERRQRSQYPEE